MRRSLEAFIRSQILPKAIALLVCLSIAVVAMSVYVSINNLRQAQKVELQNFSDQLDRAFESFQNQISNLALNDFVVNSLVDFSTHDTYLPIFFRSLRISGVENVSIIYTDFAGEVIAGKDVALIEMAQMHFDWKEAVLEQSQSYFSFNQHGVFTASPIFYANSAEAALAAYVPNIKSLLGESFVSDDLMIVTTKEGLVTFSNQPSVITVGAFYQVENFQNSFVSESDFGSVKLHSLKPTSEVYIHILELIALMSLTLLVVVLFLVYSIRLASKLATQSLNELQVSMATLATQTEEKREVHHNIDEPIEFYRIRQDFTGLVESLIDTSMSRDKFLNIINLLDEFLLVVGFDGDIILCNESIEKFASGMRFSLAKDWIRLFPDGFITMSAQDAVDDEYSSSKKYRFKVGSKVQFAEVVWHRKLYKNASGDSLGYIVSGSNVTLEKSLQAELLIQTKAIEEASSPIIISDAATGFVTYVNKAFTQLTGYSAAEMIGRNCNILQGEDTDPKDIDALRRAIKEQVSISVTIINYKKDGALFKNNLTLNPIFNDEGIMTHIVGLQFDVTERELTERYLNEAKDKAEESARLKSDFLASMSHEIRTPMNGVLGMLSLLSNSSLNAEQQHRVGVAQNSAKSLLTLINDILDFSKVEAGKLELEELDFDLIHMLGEFVESVALQVHNKGLELILDTSQVMHSYVKGDSGRVRQVLTNIVGNAIKFTPQGEIVIRVATVQASAGYITLSCTIEDTGIGIPHDKVANLFDSFSQVDASTTRKYGGTGLGLAIVKKLCLLMSGDIKAFSSEGKGSGFSFTIQLQEGQSRAENLPKVNMSELDVLIVDDNKTNRVVLRTQLEGWGATVYEAIDAEDALQVCFKRIQSGDKSIFDLAILDMEMPGMNGVALGEKLLAKQSYGEMKLIMMTSVDNEFNSQYFSDMGFSAYFSKPATVSDLYHSIKIVMDAGESLECAEPFPNNKHLKTIDPAHEESEPLSVLLQGARILLVDDNQINQLVGLGLLEEEGIIADVAGNGIEALDCLKKAKDEDAYALVLMDCQMPEMDGYDATRAIRRGEAGEHNSDIAIVAMTANAMIGDREKCLASGMSDYLSKPIVGEKLFSMLKAWIVK